MTASVHMLSNNQDPSARGFQYIVLGCSGPVSPRSHGEPSSACRAGVPSPVFCSLFIHAICFPPFSSCFIPSPLHIIPSPLCPHPLPLTLSHPPLRSHLSDSSFFHCSASPTPPPTPVAAASLLKAQTWVLLWVVG